MSKILILLLYLFFITFCAYPAWNDYNVRAINNIEGLPDKHVNQILQDIHSIYNRLLLNIL